MNNNFFVCRAVAQLFINTVLSGEMQMNFYFFLGQFFVTGSLQGIIARAEQEIAFQLQVVCSSLLS
jgi:hypothetical protein